MTDTQDQTGADIHAPNSRPSGEHSPSDDLVNPRLSDQLSCARVRVGQWDDYGIRTLVSEEERYGSVQLQVPTGLPLAWSERLAEFATQHIPYTDRDGEWDAVSRGGVTSNSDLWNCFVDSVLEAMRFARNAVEHAVWAHARGEEWNWPYPAPGRIEDKYEMWGEEHPFTHLYSYPEVLRAPTEADIEF